MAKTAKKAAWEWCSKYIRFRDAVEYHSNNPSVPLGYVKCCTCPTVKFWKHGDAGHFIDRGSGGMSGVYFDERNIHFQCKPCNAGLYQGMNKVDTRSRYEEFMKEKYGQGVIDELRWLDKNQSYRNKIRAVGEMYKQMFKSLEAQNKI